MSLRAKLDAYKAASRAAESRQAEPSEVRLIVEKAMAELFASDQASHAIKLGDDAPSFELQDQDGRWTSSLELLTRGPLIITFYRGVWCPYCNLELQALNEFLPIYRKYGANLVAVSPQLKASSRRSARINRLQFPVLSDAGNRIAAEFGLRWDLPNCLVDLYKSLGVNLPTFNGDSSWALPLPARYVVGTDGKVRYSQINPDYTSRSEPKDILSVIGPSGEPTEDR